MSAEILGRQLLEEVVEESLDTLLRALQSESAPAVATLGVPPLDRLLAVLQTPSQTRPRHHQTQWSTQAAPSGQPSRNETRAPVIEITGVSACSGKTQLLYHIIVAALLEQSYGDPRLRDEGSAVVLLDLSHRFSILRLRDVMCGYLVKAQSSADQGKSDFAPQEIEELVKDSLTHLHVFQLHSTVNLIATLESLPGYLLAQPSSHLSANRRLDLIAINDLGAFFPHDRLESAAEAATTSTAAQTSNAITLHNARYRSLTSTLQRLQTLFSAPIVVTNTALASPTNQGSSQLSVRPHLPVAWFQYCTLQLLVERDRVTKFGPGVSVEEAQGERSQRWEAVQRSGFSAWVNWWNSGSWREEVREGLRGLDGGGRFKFRVDDSGVHIEEPV